MHAFLIVMLRVVDPKATLSRFLISIEQEQLPEAGDQTSGPAECQDPGLLKSLSGLTHNLKSCFLCFFVANTFQIQPFHRDWRSRQMWLFALCQEHKTDINYHCWLHWHKLSHGSYIILGILSHVNRTGCRL
jgi:hypothetical protein